MALSTAFLDPYNQQKNNMFTVGNNYQPQFNLNPTSYGNPQPSGQSFANLLRGPINQPQGDLNTNERNVLNQNGVSLEPIEGDSLTQFLRSMFNQGSQQYNNLLNGGTQGVGQAMDTSSLLSGGAGQSMDTLANMMRGGPQAVDYYSKILSGNKAAMMDAASPEIQNVNANFNQAQRQAGQYAPMGGGRANLMSQLPLQRAAAIGNIFQNVRPQAAQQLGALGMSSASQLGNMGMSALNLFGNLGMGQQGMGRDILGLILSGQLQRRGQNVNETDANKSLAGQLGSSAIGAFG